MDGSRFDALARSLARTTSRRRATAALALAALGAFAGGRAPAAAQAPACGPDDLNKRCGGCGDCRPSGKRALFGYGPEILVCVAFDGDCMDEGTTDDNCGTCDRATLTCTPPRKCGPCEKCFSNRKGGCTYVATGRDDQCVDPATAPCIAATGECGCGDPLIYCDPDCVDPRSDLKHCGGCHNQCDPCEKCEDGRCVRCDRTCERCSAGECVPTCEGNCFTVCRRGTCVEPDPPVCVCGEEGEGEPPAAKRVYLPVVGARGAQTEGVQPCGEGDARQCCVPEECMNASEGGKVCCPPDGACGDLCCKFGEQCTAPGCCCPQSLVDISGRCVQCL